VVDLSSFLDDKDLIPDTSRDEEFAMRLFGDLNRGVLGSPDDDKVIILSDSDQEEEMCEEDATDVKATSSSAGKSPAPTASINDTDKGRSPDWAIGDSNNGGDEVGLP
jgi:hypothetical protein